MNLAQKLPIAYAAINSISRHDDEDAAVRLAFLAQVEAHVKAEREAIDARVAARVEALGSAANV
jgi:hypothetical protein